jgi:hypothetical protein
MITGESRRRFEYHRWLSLFVGEKPLNDRGCFIEPLLKVVKNSNVISHPERPLRSTKIDTR